MSFTLKCVQDALNLLLEERSDSIFKDLNAVAMNNFLGKYDGIIRVPNKKRDEKTEAFVISLRVIRAVCRQYANTGKITYGQVDAPPVEKFVSIKNFPDVMYVARVEEFESGWGSRFDGHIICFEKDDHKALLKSKCGKHLHGDEREFSTIVSEFTLRKLSATGKPLLMNLMGNNRAIWVDHAEQYIEV